MNGRQVRICNRIALASFQVLYQHSARQTGESNREINKMEVKVHDRNDQKRIILQWRFNIYATKDYYQRYVLFHEVTYIRLSCFVSCDNLQDFFSQSSSFTLATSHVYLFQLQGLLVVIMIVVNHQADGHDRTRSCYTVFPFVIQIRE